MSTLFESDEKINNNEEVNQDSPLNEEKEPSNQLENSEKEGNNENLSYWTKVKNYWKEVFSSPKSALNWGFYSFIWLAIILLIIDIVTKVLAMNLLTEGESIMVIPHLLEFTLTYNTGMARGVGGDEMWSRVALAVVSWVAAIFIIGYYIIRYKKHNKFTKAMLMIILAGDIGNLIDRTFFFDRGVVDFLDITQLIPRFGIFNFADSCLVVGIFMYMGYLIYEWIKEAIEENKSKKPKK